MRVMIWNIQQYGTNKINDANVQACIMSTIYAPSTAAPVIVPDILIVFEVLGRPGNSGTINGQSGAAGMATLLGLLQAQNAAWEAVPPIITGDAGRAESVGVFFLNTSCTFTGPHIWSTYGAIPAGQIAAQTAPWTTIFAGGVPANANYPGPWNVGTFAAAGAPAPQMWYPNAANTGFLDFPNPWFRGPVRTTFQYPPGGAGLVDIWSIHTSPGWIGGASMPTGAMTAIAGIADIAVPPAANETRLVCGDLNVDAQSTGSYNAAFGAFTGLGYVPQLGTAAASNINPPADTMFLQTGGFYDFYTRELSVDNFLSWTHAGTPIVGCWVVDRVAGTPANYVTDLATPLATIGALPTAGAQASSFRSWANFGHIGNRPRQGNMLGVHGASDHLPILIQF